MPHSEWKYDYSVGNEILDGQHRGLLNLCGILEDLASESSIGSTNDFHDALNELAAYAKEHFATEEAILETAGYTALDEQCYQHETYQEELLKFLSAATMGVFLKAELAGFVKAWWRSHILVEDMLYKPFLEGKSTLIQR